jgi:hypothetical protein
MRSSHWRRALFLLLIGALLLPPQLVAQGETPLPTTPPLPAPPAGTPGAATAVATSGPRPPEVETPTSEGVNAPTTTTAQPTSTRDRAADDEPPTARPTREPTPRVDERPDGAEPNNAREQARSIGLDSISGPFTFLPEGDVDWFSLDLGAQEIGLPVELTVRATGGVEPVVTIYRAEEWTPLALVDSPAISTTLPTELVGWLVLKVENRSPALALGQSYRLEARRTLPPPPAPLDTTQERPQLKPDGLENNWDFRSASPVGVGASYDLNFVCPDPRPDACAGGDHDYLRLTVKAGLRYLITTYDLAPGVDTVLDLYFGSEEAPIASSDDERPQGGMLSTLRWVAPADGTAVLRVGPRTGADSLIGFDEKTGSYRLAVALADTPLAQELEQRIAEQTNAPTPTPTPTATTSMPPADSPTVDPAAPWEEYPSDPLVDDGSSGSGLDPVPTSGPDLPSRNARPVRAVVIAETALRVVPDPEGEVLELLPIETVISFTGTFQGAWIWAETDTSVVPGWVYAPHLRKQTGSSTEQDSGSETPASEATAQAQSQQATATSATPTPTTIPLPRLVPASPEPAPTSLPPPARITRSVSVRLIARLATPANSRPVPLPTLDPASARPLSGIRVQLVDGLGDLLTEGLTDRDGRITLTRDVDTTTALRVRIPAAGVTVPLPATTSSLAGREAELLITLPVAEEASAP